ARALEGEGAGSIAGPGEAQAVFLALAVGALELHGATAADSPGRGAGAVEHRGARCVLLLHAGFLVQLRQFAGLLVTEPETEREQRVVSGRSTTQPDLRRMLRPGERQSALEVIRDAAIGAPEQHVGHTRALRAGQPRRDEGLRGI